MHFLKQIFNKKIIFKKVKKAKILILDDNFSQLNFKNISYHKYNSNNYYIKEFLISFFLFTKNFFKISFGKIYFNQITASVSPKLAIGHEFNKKIFLFKKLNPNKIAIGYQFGFIFKNDIYLYYKKHFNKEKLDYYFVYDDRSEQIMKKFVDSKYILNGCTKVNEKYNIFKKNIKKKYDIAFISRFRSFKYKKKNNFDLFLVKIIFNYCKKNNLNFVILFASRRKDKLYRKNFFQEEKRFYDSVINDYKIGDKDGLYMAKISKLTICSNSNLGYELLFASEKVVFFSSKFDNHKFF